MKDQKAVFAEIERLYGEIQKHYTVIGFKTLQLKELADSIVAAKVKMIEDKKPDEKPVEKTAEKVEEKKTKKGSLETNVAE